MNIHEFRKIVDAIDDSLESYNDKTVTVRLSSPSIGATASIEVAGIIDGFDWDNQQVMINTRMPVVLKGEKK